MFPVILTSGLALPLGLLDMRKLIFNGVNQSLPAYTDLHIGLMLKGISSGVPFDFIVTAFRGYESGLTMLFDHTGAARKIRWYPLKR